MFNGIPKLSELLNTPKEWHVAWTGFCHSFYKPRYMPPKMLDEMADEYHYYSTGRLVGHIVKATAIVVITALIWRRKR